MKNDKVKSMIVLFNMGGVYFAGSRFLKLYLFV